ncbi:PepSY domain-containing protein [Microbacterium sp. HMH0099]|uniref:PepSY domain-containing protein n=1 Tax=Microbacterium sp. HMH0099 TaxID=3414026 RepID=UPI003BF6937C
MNRTPAFALLAVASALVLTSCSNGSDAAAPTVTVTADQGSGAQSSAAPAPTGGGSDTASTWETAVAAATTAESSAGGRAIELDQEDDGTWEVHVAAGDREVEVRVSADGSTVDSSRDDDEDRAALDSAVTTLADAIRIAAAQNPSGAGIDDVTLDDEDGTWAWEVGFRDDVDVYVSAADGAILRTDR